MKDIIKAIDKKILDNKTIYKGVNFSELIIADLYIRTNRSLDIRRLIKLSLPRFINANNSKVKQIQRINNLEAIKNKKYIFIQMFHAWDDRHFKTLDSLLLEVTKTIDKKEILIITPNKNVQRFYKNIDVLYIGTPRFTKVNIKHAGLDRFQNMLISRGIDAYDIALEIFKQVNPKIVFTTQDFHIYDQIFTKAAKSLGILTITHQHGMMPYPHPGLFKYVFSDYIMVWGDSTYRNLKEFIPKDKIKVVGTNNFNYLLKKPKSIERDSITLGLNSTEEKENIQIITKVLSILNASWNELREIKKLIIKLHPALNKRHWQDLINKIIKANKIKIDYLVSTENNYDILYRTQILIANKSTISMEAMLAGCSVLELDTKEHYNENRLFLSMPESIVGYENLFSEIHKRLIDKNYADCVLDKQRTIIKDEIEEFSVQKEMAFIKELLSKG